MLSAQETELSEDDRLALCARLMDESRSLGDGFEWDISSCEAVPNNTSMKWYSDSRWTAESWYAGYLFQAEIEAKREQHGLTWKDYVSSGNPDEDARLARCARLIGAVSSPLPEGFQWAMESCQPLPRKDATTGKTERERMAHVYWFLGRNFRMMMELDREEGRTLSDYRRKDP